MRKKNTRGFAGEAKLVGNFINIPMMDTAGAGAEEMGLKQIPTRSIKPKFSFIKKSMKAEGFGLFKCRQTGEVVERKIRGATMHPAYTTAVAQSMSKQKKNKDAETPEYVYENDHRISVRGYHKWIETLVIAYPIGTLDYRESGPITNAFANFTSGNMLVGSFNNVSERGYVLDRRTKHRNYLGI